MVIPSTGQLTQQVKQAMQMFAPEMYRRLEASGELERYAEQKAETMLNEFSEQFGPVWMETISAKANLGAMEGIQAADSAQRQIWEKVVANHLVFREETTTASSRAS